MKKLNKNIFAVMMVVVLTLPVTLTASAYTIDNTYQLTLNEGDSRRAANKFVVLHDVGTESSALNNAIYMKRAWSQTESYTQFIVGDGGKVYKVGEDGYVSWGAGSYVNANAPVQIELAHTYDRATFDKDYAVYVNLARDFAIKYGIPLTLDDGNMYTSGIKSHLWVTNNVWGDHTDPYGYLARFGVSKEKLAADLRTGLNEGSSIIPEGLSPYRNFSVEISPFNEKEALSRLQEFRKAFPHYSAHLVQLDNKKQYKIIVQPFSYLEVNAKHVEIKSKFKHWSMKVAELTDVSQRKAVVVAPYTGEEAAEKYLELKKEKPGVIMDLENH